MGKKKKPQIPGIVFITAPGGVYAERVDDRTEAMRRARHFSVRAYPYLNTEGYDARDSWWLYKDLRWGTPGPDLAGHQFNWVAVYYPGLYLAKVFGDPMPNYVVFSVTRNYLGNISTATRVFNDKESARKKMVESADVPVATYDNEYDGITFKVEDGQGEPLIVAYAVKIPHLVTIV